MNRFTTFQYSLMEYILEKLGGNPTGMLMLENLDKAAPDLAIVIPRRMRRIWFPGAGVLILSASGFL